MPESEMLSCRFYVIKSGNGYFVGFTNGVPQFIGFSSSHEGIHFLHPDDALDTIARIHQAGFETQIVPVWS